MTDSRQPTHHGYAVDVKDHATYFQLDHGTLSEEEVDLIYERAVMGFWDAAGESAREHGFREIYAEGRSGGWAVPHPQPDPDDEEGLVDWFRDTFRPLERDLLAELDHWRGVFREELAEVVKSAEREPVEAAHWAARDVVTVD